MEKPGVSFDEKIQASAAQFLINKQEEQAAIILLSCSLELYDVGDWDITAYNAIFTGSYYAYEILEQENHPITSAIRAAFQAVLPLGSYVKYITSKAILIDIEPGWKPKMLEIVQGKEVHNQGVSINNRTTITWNN